MAKVDTGVPGVSGERRHNDTLRLVWRQRRESEHGPPVTARKAPKGYWTLPDGTRDSDVRESALRVKRALGERGWFEPPQTLADAYRLHGTFTLDDAIAAYLIVRGARLRTEGSRKRVEEGMRNFANTVRHVLKIPHERPVLGPEAFNPQTFAKVTTHWKEIGGPRGKPYADSTLARLQRNVLACWAMLRDDPDRWPGVTGGILTAQQSQQRVHHEALTAPTLDEMRTVVRLALDSDGQRRSLALPEVLLLCSVIGCRPSQALELTVGAVDCDSATLWMDRGHKRSTKRYPRRIPIPRWLADAIAYRLDGRDGGERVFDEVKTVSRKALQRLLTRAEVRPETWRGEFVGRENNRAFTWFRAGVQAHLGTAGAREAAIDKIVGHAPATVRERHYAPATTEQIRAAIELMPPMDWGPGIATVQWGYGVPTVSPRDNVVRLRGA